MPERRQNSLLMGLLLLKKGTIVEVFSISRQGTRVSEGKELAEMKSDQNRKTEYLLGTDEGCHLEWRAYGCYREWRGWSGDMSSDRSL